ncbi:uncharacterized protein LOC117322521 isoform X1 [Pecten maximus]|uniref:uncharacterized protein LOC117322521 isoform X1 n=1 Tax=Pecten maximus TaxID=6579 RepID=UPI001458D4EC|nr:uncharacterized protein LOC117322521 isoform X1 [Pecten maximus]
MGRIMGPFSKPPIANFHISPIGVVSKSDGGWRMITHLSFPPSESINDFINPELCSVNYTSFDTVVEMISKLGQGALLGKADIKSAFRLIPIYPGDFDLLGFQFLDKYYIDKCLPMGCSISCNIFEKFSTFIEWLVRDKTGVNTVSHYLDDFIFAGKRGSQDCQILMSTFDNSCRELGVPIAEEKTVGPTTVIIFLGLEIDTVEMLIRIPLQKTIELTDMLLRFVGQKKVTLKELESLVGVLNFFCRALRSGRPFLRRLYDATSKVSKPYHFIRVSGEMREDLLVWLHFIQNFNGTLFFPDSAWSDSDVLQLFTDSAGNAELGCGAYFHGEWAYFQWPRDWASTEKMRDITFLEFIPIVLALSIWGHKLVNRKIIFHIDNSALVSVLNAQSSKDKIVMELMRPFVIELLQHNILFKARHVPGVENVIADSISRMQWNRFRSVAPQAQVHPARIPGKFRSLISRLK